MSPILQELSLKVIYVSFLRPFHCAKTKKITIPSDTGKKIIAPLESDNITANDEHKNADVKK